MVALIPKHIPLVPHFLRPEWLLVVRFMDWFALKGPGYQWASSLGLGFGLPLVYYWHHTCHVRTCFWLGHTDPEHGHPACRKHHSLSHKLGVSV